MKKLIFALLIFISLGLQAKPPQKSKFYNFSDQLIDGEIRRPIGTYTTSKEKVRFDRLLRLKKSFLPNLFRTSKSKIFK